mgnify:CR=1 FL=1
MENLKQLMERMIDREIERNQILADSQYANFALSEEEAFNQGMETFQKELLKKMGGMISGDT